MIGYRLLSASGSTKKPVEYVGGAVTASKTNTLSLTGLDIQQDDVLLFVASDDSASFGLSSTGWTDIEGGAPTRRSVTAIEHMVAWKRVVTTPDTSIVMTQNVDVIQVLVLRSASDIPIYYELSNYGTSASIFDLNSTTVLKKGSMAVIVTCLDDDNSTIAVTPSGYTISTQGKGGGGSGATSSGAILYEPDLLVGTHDAPSGQWSSSDGLFAMGIIIPPK